ncbi:ribosomal protection-like ABC-F family protein [Flavobacterium beibuense]|uniref:ABC transporter related protein n=1 Tax=Flavobacterium beibuense TaxID=657326 RepID=A0A444WA45_9FLAO|nr:ABC-F family ATP-binding cassette domain-containing protein [Flavobacterium beibuense]RYJ42488.1 ABC transporter related protein [Flavobacterium beibuense]
MLILQNVCYTHTNRDILFSNVNITLNKHEKIALIGNNGVGKSTLLKILAGLLQPAEGLFKTDSVPYYVPQLLGQYNDMTIAEALGIHKKLNAYNEILSGNVTEKNMAVLDDDWSIEERYTEAFAQWGLKGVNPMQKMNSLSGGQKTKVFLAGILIHNPEMVLLDEPSNHLDTEGRKILYDFIKTTNTSLIIVSHDRTLLNLLTTVCELTPKGINVYGGNYDFYAEQKKIEAEALENDLKSREKALRKAKEVEKETIERQQKLDSRGKKKQEKAGLPTISMNTLKNSAEKSTAKIKGVHAEKVASLTKDLQDLRSGLSGTDKMKVNLDSSDLHKGKVLVKAQDINISYDSEPLWKNPLSFDVISGERIAIKGANGSGKTSLIKIITGELEPVGNIKRADFRTVYVNQEYSLLKDDLSVYQQAQEFNTGGLQEHDIKMRLNRFLFSAEYWDKPCSVLSGGEKMRLLLCALTIGNQAPDVIILDEPTNNLDILNLEILTQAINQYQGTLIVVSHDEYFLKEINVNRKVILK